MATSADKSSSVVDGDGAVSIAVVEAVSSVTDTPVLELPPLYEFIDPDSLDALFSGRKSVGRVEFRYAGHRVAVYGDQTVNVSKLD